MRTTCTSLHFRRYFFQMLTAERAGLLAQAMRSGQRKYFYYWPFLLSFRAPFCFGCMSNSQRACVLLGLPALLPYRVYKQDPTHNFTITKRKHSMFFVVYSFCLLLFFTVFILFFRNVAQLIFNMSRQS